MTANETLSITVDDAKVRAAFARLKKIGTVFPAHAGMNRCGNHGEARSPGQDSNLRRIAGRDPCT